MANAWDVTDGYLARQLLSIINAEVEDANWSLHLYQNDYTPIPGSDETDYVECDFPGYTALDLLWLNWGTVTVLDHVARSVYVEFLEFEAASSGFTSQPVYGYYVLDGDAVYIWGERFADTRTMYPSSTLKVKPERRQGVLPPPT